MVNQLNVKQETGNPASAMDVPAVSLPVAPEGLTPGIYFVVTHWLAPIAQDLIEWAVTALVVTATRTFERELRGVAADLNAAFNDILQQLDAAAAAYAVPLAGQLAHSVPTTDALVTYLQASI